MVADDTPSANPDQNPDPPTGSAFWELGSTGFGMLADGDDSHPEKIGSYEILEVLGEGGMGVVYLAQQNEPVRRQVAIKLIKRGMDTKEIVARFESERQALALMTHPNIARVYDAGTTDDGLPYFVMEYVQAIPITRYSDEHHLTTRERLELFIKVLEGIQHAHQKAIIHRDLKPSNVLVADLEGVAVPKIIDFGIAKATDQRLTEKTLCTELGQVMGTPEYMSPEQAAAEDTDIDTRTDIYSLGTILYELLTGALPFESQALRKGGYAGLVRIICERIPEKPSTRVITDGRTAVGKSDRPETPDRPLIREIRGDLDWITLKALEKDRSRRYASASEFAEDIRRHLRMEPVLAGPPSTFYRLRKYAQRNRDKVGAALLISFLALVAVIYYFYDRHARLEETLEMARKEKESFLELFDQQEEWEQTLRMEQTRSEPAQPPWQRRDENRALYNIEKNRATLNDHSLAASTAFKEASDLALLPDSKEEINKEKGAILYRLYTKAREDGSIQQFPDHFAREIEALGIDDYAALLERSGSVSLRTRPPGADVFCFRYETRYETNDLHLLPLPFKPDRGLLDETFLEIESVWDSERSSFRAGDRLRSVNDRAVASRADFADALRGVSTRESVRVVVLRGDSETTFDWIPFPNADDSIAAGNVVDMYHQFGFIFAGYPLAFSEASRVGKSDDTGQLKLRLPEGSYLFVFKKTGFSDTRLSVSIPELAGEKTVRLFKREEIPEGFVHVPAGSFIAGGDPGSYEGLKRQRAELASFFIRRFEVTFLEYLEFVRDMKRRRLIDPESGRMPPRAPLWKDPEFQWLNRRVMDRGISLIPLNRNTELIQRRDGEYELNVSNNQLPVLGISMLAAVEYAHWLTEKHANRWRFRLPRDLEWEKAARGVDGRVFVWGSHLNLTLCRSLEGVIPERRSGRPELIGTYPIDESVYGVRDMSGSSSEITLSKASSLNYVIYRGGNWLATDPRDFRVTTRNRIAPEQRREFLGIRLVAEIPDAE